MTQALRRITTEYIETEDRLRVAGDLPDGGAVVIWLTQRMLARVLPLLLQWLEKNPALVPPPQAAQPVAQAVQHFEQQAARVALAPQAPVRAQADSLAWLAQSAQIERSPHGVRLLFEAPGGNEALLVMAPKPLRQWLNIVHDQWLKAGWPMALWPAWMRDEPQGAAQQRSMMH